jgi:hypothetical protein
MSSKLDACYRRVFDIDPAVREQRNRWPGTVLVLALIGAIVGFLLSSAHWAKPDPSAAIEASDVASSRSALGISDSASASLSSVPALPPVDAAVIEILDELKARSARGDARAACRMAYELGRCRMLSEARRSMDEGLDRAAAAAPASAEEGHRRAELANTLSFVDAASAACSGLPASESNDAWRHLLAVADAGNVDAMLQFSLRPPLSEQQFAGDLDGWTAY